MKKIFIVIMTIPLLTSCVLRHLSTQTIPEINLSKEADISIQVIQPATKIIAMGISPDGSLVASANADETLRLWNVVTGKQEKSIYTGDPGNVSKVAFSPDNKYVLVSYGRDNEANIFDVSTGELVRILGKTEKFNTCIAVSPDGKYVAVGNRDAHVRIYEMKTGIMISDIKAYESSYWATNAVWAISISPDSKYLILGDFYGELKLFEIKTRKEVCRFEKTNATQSLTFSPDGKWVVSGDHYGYVRIWEIATQKLIKTLKHTDGSWGSRAVMSLAFSNNGKLLLSGSMMGSVILWNVETGEELLTHKNHKDFVVTVLFSQNDKYAISGSLDATVRIWKVDTGEDIALMAGFGDNAWIVMSSDGHYNASPNAHEFLRIVKGGKIYRTDQFYDVFYRPDIVTAKIRGEDIKDLITVTMQDAIKSPPPAVEVTSHTLGTDREKAKVCYRVKSTGGGIGEVRLFHNGKLIQSDGYYREVAKSPTAEKMQLASLNSRAIYDDMRTLTIKARTDSTLTTAKPKGDVFEDCKEIDAILGENEVSVSAFNGTNTVQSYMKTIKFNSSVKTEDPHLYILSVGIDRYKDNTVNLKYAVKDARDIESKLKTQAATLYKPENIHFQLLTDAEATKAKITEKIEDLSRKIKPQDSFILFVAGHGVLLQNQYYMLTHDFNGHVSNINMISSNEIVEASKKIKSLSQLLIFDTCHAGGVDTIVSGLYDARMSVLAKKMGLHIYASASDKQAAMDGYRGNGLFTYTLLDGLNNNKQADKNKDGKVSVVGLGGYSKERTTQISREIGHAQTPLIINFGKDYPIYQLR